MEKQTKSNTSKFRLWTQAAAFAFSNGYINGWRKGKIYPGENKVFCLPGLNCYSCPGALASCPIGSLQAVLDNGKYRFSLYIFAVIGFLGVAFGRLICGWICPFGLFQDLLHKIPLFGKKKNLPGHKVLKYLKYAILVIFVILLPMFITNAGGGGQPWFCEYICPSGTLLGGIPLVIMNKNLRAAIGPRFIWKCVVLAAIIILSIRYYRPFCKYLCPLGALYGFANPVSTYRLRVNKDACVSCGACQKACGMDIKVWEDPNSPECIRCGKCKSVCPKGAITTTWSDWKKGITCPDPETLRPVIEPVSEEENAPAAISEEPKPAAPKGRNFLGSIVFTAAIFMLLASVVGPITYLFSGSFSDLIQFAGYSNMFAAIPPLIFLMVLGIKIVKAKDDNALEITRQFAKVTLLTVPLSIIIAGLVITIAAAYYNFGISEILVFILSCALSSPLVWIIVCLLAVISMNCCKKWKSGI